jgi:O-antigen/teichoic acid export membrane protein
MRTFGSLTVAGQVESALSFATTATLVRLAGSTEAGEVLFAQAMATVWFLLCDPRLEDAQQRFVPAEQLHGPGHGTRLYLRLLGLDIAAGVLATAVGVVVLVTAATAGWISIDQFWLLVPAVLAAGAATPSGSASAGFAIADQLSRLGVIRLFLAVFGCLTTLAALLAAGSVGYLAATVATALVSTVVLTIDACRQVREACGSPAAGPVVMPAGLVPFLVKSSATGSVSMASDSGVSVLAGLLGGPTLVTYLKIAAAPGRLFASFVSSVAAQLYPRLARAGAQKRRAAVMSDSLRSSVLTGSIGAVTVGVAACLLSRLLGLVYGPEYTMLATATLLLLAGAALRGTVVWCKVLPSALGFPGVRLVFLTAEGVCQAGILVGVINIWTDRADMTLAFAWGCLGLLLASTVGWFVVLRVLVLLMPPPDGRDGPRPMPA